MEEREPSGPGGGVRPWEVAVGLLAGLALPILSLLMLALFRRTHPALAGWSLFGAAITMLLSLLWAIATS